MAHGDRYADHPLEAFRTVVDRFGPMRASFSRYEVGPPGDQERRPREVFHVAAEDVDDDWLDRELQRLGSDQELALHSAVEWRGGQHHLYLVDYGVGCPATVVTTAAATLIAEDDSIPRPSGFGVDIFNVESGGSHHQYATVLIPADAWHAHIGALLLLTPPGSAQFVDTRWLGHALRRGYAALRWSHNTDRYLMMPKLVGRTTLDPPGD